MVTCKIKQLHKLRNICTDVLQHSHFTHHDHSLEQAKNNRLRDLPLILQFCVNIKQRLCGVDVLGLVQ